MLKPVGEASVIYSVFQVKVAWSFEIKIRSDYGVLKLTTLAEAFDSLEVRRHDQHRPYSANTSNVQGRNYSGYINPSPTHCYHFFLIEQYLRCRHVCAVCGCGV